MRILFSIIIFLITASSKGQNFETHTWKNRVLIMISKSQESEIYKKQLDEINTSSKAFVERKLIVYCVLPNQYIKIDHSQDSSKNEWISSSDLFKTYSKEDSEFKIILIGLDGSIKHQRDKLMTSSELFEKIDSMPMRQSEMRNKDN